MSVKEPKKICPSFGPSRIILKKAGEIQPPVPVWVGKLLEKKPMKIDLEIIMPPALDVVKLQKYKSMLAVPLFEVPACTHLVQVFYMQEPELDYVEAEWSWLGCISAQTMQQA